MASNVHESSSIGTFIPPGLKPESFGEVNLTILEGY
jgi:hypothetical protein